MKKYISYLLVMAILLCFCACSRNNQKVPDQYIEDVVEERFGDSAYFATHDFDKSAYIDTVSIEVMRDHTYYREFVIGKCKFRYNKSNDTWDSYKEPEWKTDRVEYFASKYLGEWEGTFRSGGSYSVNISDVDFEKGIITGSFTARKSIAFSGGDAYELNVNGTYDMSEEYEGYELEITQDGITFVFMLNKYYGVQGVTIYNARTGYAV